MSGKQDPFPIQPESALLSGTALAVAYSGYREGQHPNRGDAEKAPSDDEIREDLAIVAQHFPLIRLYDSGILTRRVLALIREEGHPIKVMLGAWLNAELSNHVGCAWVTEPVPEARLAAQGAENEREVERAIQLAQSYEDVVIAVNVGNESLVTWNDHLVSIERMVEHIQRTKDAIKQPVTTADNYVPWIEYANQLAEVVDFAGIHTYPLWEGRDIHEGLPYTIENMAAVHAALPNTPLAIVEAGWTSVAEEFGDRASFDKQKTYFDALWAWSRSHNVTTFFFEAFDEPWKGNPSRPMGAEKHWGLFDVQRRPKLALQSMYPNLEPSPGP